MQSFKEFSDYILQTYSKPATKSKLISVLDEFEKREVEHSNEHDILLSEVRNQEIVIQNLTSQLNEKILSNPSVQKTQPQEKLSKKENDAFYSKKYKLQDLIDDPKIVEKAVKEKRYLNLEIITKELINSKELEDIYKVNLFFGLCSPENRAEFYKQK